MSILIAVMISPSSWAKSAPLYAGLPETLSAEIFADESLIPFESVNETIRAPVGTHIEIDGQSIPASDFKALTRYFSRELFAKIPRESKIRISRDSRLGEIWDYPVGTLLVDRIQLRSRPPRDFEVRMISKLPSGRWAFGTYLPESPETQGRYRLAKYSGFAPYRTHFRNQEGSESLLKLGRINLNSCQACHFSVSPSKSQYQGISEAGPCAFGPANPLVTSDWASRYLKQHGVEPFIQQN
jgi:hypothetical protein